MGCYHAKLYIHKNVIRLSTNPACENSEEWQSKFKRLRSLVYRIFFFRPAVKAILAVLVVTATIGLAVFAYFYLKYSKQIEDKLAAGPFANTSMLFAATPSRCGWR